MYRNKTREQVEAELRKALETNEELLELCELLRKKRDDLVEKHKKEKWGQFCSIFKTGGAFFFVLISLVGAIPLTIYGVHRSRHNEQQSAVNDCNRAGMLYARHHDGEVFCQGDGGALVYLEAGKR